MCIAQCASGCGGGVSCSNSCHTWCSAASCGIPHSSDCDSGCGSCSYKAWNGENGNGCTSVTCTGGCSGKKKNKPTHT